MTNQPTKKISSRFIYFFGAFGGILFGYDIGVMTGALPFLQKDWHLTDAGTIGWITSSLMLGAIVGGALAGQLSDKLGRRRMILAASFVFAIGSVMAGISPNDGVAWLLIARTLLDPTGDLQPGTRLAPPEGDAGTGMVATNSVNKRTGNISVGTSIFSMIVLEKPLAHVYSNIDIVTTPTGLPVAMVHANNSASDINAWAKLFAEFAQKIGHDLSTKDLYQVLFDAALTDATPDAGGLSGYGYYSGENITGVPEGRPLLVRQPDAIFSVGNLMRLHIFSAFGAIKIGMRLLADEDVLTDNIVAQGGVFKTPVVA